MSDHVNLDTYKAAQKLIGAGQINVLTPWQQPADANAVTGYLGTDGETPCCPVGADGKVHASALRAYMMGAGYNDACYQLASKLLDQIRAVTFAEAPPVAAETALEMEFKEKDAASLQIFRAGKHTDSAGRTVTFSAEDIAATASGYDPAVHEAPIVVGHPAADTPAYGWVESLKVKRGVLEARPHQVEPTFAEMVKAGRFKKISSSLYPPDHPSNPKPGIWYLKHVGFLGAAAPAVKGLRNASFAEEGMVVFESPMVFNASSNLLPADVPGSMKVKEATMAEQTTVTAAGTAQASFAEELAKRDKEIDALKAGQRLKDERSFVDGLVREGKLPPALAKRGLAEFLSALDDGEVVTFAEAGKDGEKEIPAVKGTRAGWLRETLKAMPQVLAFKELSPAGKDGGTASADPADVAAQAAEYREAERAKGREVTVTDAVAHVMKGGK